MPPEPAIASLRRRRLPLTGLGLVAALAFFGWGIVHLFELRFAGGDVYPAYSTLRKDPLGAAAFHDALAALPGLNVERNLRPLATLAQAPKLLLGPLAAPSPTTAVASPGGQADPLVCFYLGADAYEWPGLFRAQRVRASRCDHAPGRPGHPDVPARPDSADGDPSRKFPPRAGRRRRKIDAYPSKGHPHPSRQGRHAYGQRQPESVSLASERFQASGAGGDADGRPRRALGHRLPPRQESCQKRSALDPGGGRGSPRFPDARSYR